MQLANVVFDCADPLKVAAFWSAALDRPVDDGASQFFASISGPPAWFFIEVPEPKSVKNRVHVDLVSDDRPTELDRLIALGATHVADRDEWGHRWTVMLDPEGNEFCVADA